MTNSQRLATVRCCLTQWLREQATQAENSSAAVATPPGAPARITESILIRDGFYCGRRFDAGDHDAVWFVEEDQLKIYNSLGDLQAVFQGDEILRRSATAQPIDERRAA